MVGLREAARRPAFDAAHAHQPEKCVAAEPVLGTLAAEVRLQVVNTFAWAAEREAGTKRFGRPRSPSYFGTSYSRTR